MSRLQEAKWEDTPGWQWDDGPIFVGADGRWFAVEYGKAVRRLENLSELAHLSQQRVVSLRLIKILENS